MKIKVEEIREDPILILLNQFKVQKLRMHVQNLKKFLELIPNNIFEEYNNKSPKSRDTKDLAFAFTTMTKNIDVTKSIIYFRNKKIIEEFLESSILN